MTSSSTTSHLTLQPHRKQLPSNIHIHNNNLLVISVVIFLVGFFEGKQITGVSCLLLKSSSNHPRDSQIHPNHINNKQDNEVFPSKSEVTDYLIRYGYLTIGSKSKNAKGEDSVASSLTRPHVTQGGDSLENFQSALKKLQSFAGLPPTGIIDEETRKLLGRPRCGVPDEMDSRDNHIKSRTKRYTLQGGKWHRTNLTWSIQHWPKNIDPAILREELTRALKLWSDVSQLTFTETRKSDADIVVSFRSGPHGDDYPFDGPGNILAHAFFPVRGSKIAGDAHFDADEKWVKNSLLNGKNGNDVHLHDGVSLFAVAAHEFGHSLGLSHSSVPGSLMFPYYQSMKDDYTLPVDDTVGIQQLYGSRDEQKWAPIPPEHRPSIPVTTPKTPSTRPPTTWAPTLPPLRPPTEVDDELPVTCNTSFDAISSIRREVFVFKGRYFWRINDRKDLETSTPIEISRFWFFNLRDLKKVDAVYERPKDKLITFFIGRKYWVFSGNYPLVGYPRPLTNLGLPSSVNSIDAAFVWGHSGKTYLFSGNQYFRLEDSQERVDVDYPRDVNVWKGIPCSDSSKRSNDSCIDSAFTWHRNGVTYFFKRDKFWKFDNRRMRVTRDSPKKATDWWFSTVCRAEYGGIPEYFEDDDDDIKISGGSRMSLAIEVVILSSILAVIGPSRRF